MEHILYTLLNSRAHTPDVSISASFKQNATGTYNASLHSSHNHSVVTMLLLTRTVKYDTVAVES